MYFEITGQNSPTAKTVVLSAGLGGSGSFWQPQLSALGQHFRVITYDQYGTGRSSGVIPSGYTLADMADELAGLLASQHIERYHFVGHALGGMIGLQLALSHPQCVERLVAINSWPVLDSQTRRCFHVRQDLLLNSGVALMFAPSRCFSIQQIGYHAIPCCLNRKRYSKSLIFRAWKTYYAA